MRTSAVPTRRIWLITRLGRGSRSRTQVRLQREGAVRGAAAITVLWLNAAEHPRAVAAPRTLADASQLSDKRTLAVEHYRKMLELEPGPAL